MDPRLAGAVALGAGAAGLLAGALGGPAVLSLSPLKALAARWRRMAQGLGLPADLLDRRAGLSLGLLVGGLLAFPLSPLLPLLGAGASVLPFLALERAWSRRAADLERDLPWVLDFLVMGVQAGQDFEVALERSARARPGPLAAEIQGLLSAIRVGLPRRRALSEWGERSRSPALGVLASALVQADAMGSGLSQVLRAQAEGARIRGLQRAEDAAQRAPVVMLFPLVLCFFPVTFLILFGPIFFSIRW